MADSEVIATLCPTCGARLKVKPRMIGMTASCPKCQGQIIVSAPVPEPVVAGDVTGPERKRAPTGDLAATEKQRNYATSLGCKFPDSITRTAISALINEQLAANEDKKWDQINALQDRHAEAVEIVRRDLLEEMADDPQVSKATPRQMIDSLDEQGTACVMVTMPFDQVDSFDDLVGVNVAVQSSNDMTNENTAQVLMGIALGLYKRLGLLPDDS